MAAIRPLSVVVRTRALRERAAGKIGTLILMGHSQGGNDAIEIARALEISHVPVDLLVTFDPYHQKPVPANVARAINYYQRGGWGLALVPDTARLTSKLCIQFVPSALFTLLADK